MVGGSSLATAIPRRGRRKGLIQEQWRWIRLKLWLESQAARLRHFLLSLKVLVSRKIKIEQAV